jgi:hypothetical protein
MNGVTVLKKASIQRAADPVDAISSFQLAQAKVKSMNAIKTLEFYSDAIADPEFQAFLRQKLSEMCVTTGLIV